MISSDRRMLLKGAAGVSFASAVGALQWRPAFGSITKASQRADGQAFNLEVTRLEQDMIMVTGAGGNVVAAQGRDGVVLVDGGLASRADRLLDVILNEMSADTVEVLFNTHWHPERIGLNQRLGAAGAKIIAHENTRLWLGVEIERPWDDESIGPLPPEARPNDTFYTTDELPYKNQPVRYGYMLQAHTDGDMYVFFPDENVLVTGGVVSTPSAGWPLIDWWTGGWILGLVDGLDILIEVANEETRVVPGNGPVLTRSDLVAQRDMFLIIYERLIQLFFDGLSPAEAVVAEPTKDYDTEWGDSERFVTLAFQSFWGQFAPNV